MAHHTDHVSGNALLYNDRLSTRAKPRRKAIEDAPPLTYTRSRVWHHGAHRHEALLYAWQHAALALALRLYKARLCQRIDAAAAGGRTERARATALRRARAPPESTTPVLLDTTRQIRQCISSRRQWTPLSEAVVETVVGRRCKVRPVVNCRAHYGLSRRVVQYVIANGENGR